MVHTNAPCATVRKGWVYYYKQCTPTESSWICHFLIGQIKPIFFFRNGHTVYYTCAFSSLPSILFFFNDYLVISHSLGSSKLPPLVGIGTLRNYDGDGNGNVKKAISLMSKTTTLHVHHAFLYISLQSVHNYMT